MTARGEMLGLVRWLDGVLGNMQAVAERLSLPIRIEVNNLQESRDLLMHKLDSARPKRHHAVLSVHHHQEHPGCTDPRKEVAG